MRATLLRVLELKGLTTEVQLLRMASLGIRHTESDGWNGRVDYFTVDLTIPLEVFVQIEGDLEQHETRIREAAGTAWRDFESDVISSVRFRPDRHAVATGTPTPIPATNLPSFWDHGRFRLFLSHCSSQKVEVGQLKVSLGGIGICAFVAHDDIEPSRLWQTEIENALKSCEALTAIVTEDFILSSWCDQEVGFALGRSIPVFPVQWGKPPHGFIGKIQALAVPQGASLSSVAGRLVDLLLLAPQTAASMTTALVGALANAHSFANAKEIAAHLEVAPVLTGAHADLLRKAVKNNSQVRESFGVPGRITGILKRHGV